MAGPRVIYAEDYLSDNYNIPTAPRIVYDEDEEQEQVIADEACPYDDGHAIEFRLRTAKPLPKTPYNKAECEREI